jgi:hypothetical protein
MTGCAARRSAATKTASKSTPVASEAIVSASLQPFSAERTKP